MSRLADLYPMSFAAVQKHVAVLERAGLVIKERRVIYRDHLPPGLAKKFYGYEHVHWKHHHHDD